MSALSDFISIISLLGNTVRPEKKVLFFKVLEIISSETMSITTLFEAVFSIIEFATFSLTFLKAVISVQSGVTISDSFEKFEFALFAHSAPIS